MAPVQKPTIVIVPGGWTPWQAFTPLIDVFKSSGFNVVAGSHPSLDPTDIDKTSFAADVANLRDKHIRPLIDAGDEVVLIMHSYGGFVGNAAAHGLSVSTRRRANQPGGVRGIVVVSGFISPEGGDWSKIQAPEWVSLDNPRKGLTSIADVRDAHAADLPPAAAERLESMLRPMPSALLNCILPPMAWQDDDMQGRLGYLFCTDDKALPLEAQKGMLEASGKTWITSDINASHFGALVHENLILRTVEFVEQCSESFAKA